MAATPPSLLRDARLSMPAIQSCTIGYRQVHAGRPARARWAWLRGARESIRPADPGCGAAVSGGSPTALAGPARRVKNSEQGADSLRNIFFWRKGGMGPACPARSRVAPAGPAEVSPAAARWTGCGPGSGLPRSGEAGTPWTAQGCAVRVRGGGPREVRRVALARGGGLSRMGRARLAGCQHSVVDSAFPCCLGGFLAPTRRLEPGSPAASTAGPAAAEGIE